MGDGRVDPKQGRRRGVGQSSEDELSTDRGHGV